jgi:hypothetical protein
MKKSTYFDKFRGPSWPSPNEIEHYFLSASGRRQAFDTRNDSWGLSAEGLDGTTHLPAGKGRIDLSLTVLGNVRYGVFLHYDRHGGTCSEDYFSNGDLKRLREWIETKHGDLRPVGLFIPFERAWTAVKEFIETDGALPQSIAWVSSHDIPPGTFPDPGTESPIGR